MNQLPPAEDTNATINPALHKLLRERTRPPAASMVSNVVVFGWRALLKIKHLPEQLFDVVITPIMFTVMFTYLFGGAIAGSTEDYLQFLLPGILAQTVTFTSLYTGVTLNTDISKGIYDRFKSLPIWSPSPIVGAMLGDVLRYTVASTIVVMIGFIMGYRPETGATGIVFSLLLLNIFGLGLGWIFTTLGLLLRTPGAVMTLGWLVLMPLTFGSNIYVDPNTMPGWLQAFVAVNPVSHLVSAIRALMAGSATLQLIALALVAPALLTLVFGPIAMGLYRRQR